MRIPWIVCISILSIFLSQQAFAVQEISRDEQEARMVIHALLHRKMQQHHTGIIDTGKQEKVNGILSFLMKNYPLEKVKKRDDLLTLYVGPGHFYHNKLYVPKDLQIIEKTNYISLTPGIPDTQYQLRHQVHEPLQNLAQAYYKKFKTPLHINSARRSYHEQQNRFSQSCFEEGICAVPGTSEHQNGLTIDIANMHGEKYQRMRAHAHQYGFHQSYQKGKDIDKLQVEPRHRRYVGKSLAGHLKQHNSSFTQRYHFSQK